MMMWTTRKRLHNFGPTWPEVPPPKMAAFFIGGKNPPVTNAGAKTPIQKTEVLFMAFFTSAVDTLQLLVIALGAGLCVWGAINLLEGYGGDNPSSKSQGIKQLMAGGGVILLGTTLVPLLAGLF